MPKGRKPGSRNKPKTGSMHGDESPTSGNEAEAQPSEEVQILAHMANVSSVLPTEQEFVSIEKLLDYIEQADMQQYERPVARMLIIKGMELGIKALTALTQLVPKKGRIGFERAEYMRQMISKSGGALVPLESTEQICRLKAIRKVYGKVIETEYSYTVRDAMAADLLGHGGIWDTHRKDMLYARATTRAGRGMFADVIAGVSYTGEELESSVSWDGPVQSAPTGAAEPKQPPAAAPVPVQEQPAASVSPAETKPLQPAAEKPSAGTPSQAQPAEPPKTQEFLMIGSRVLDHPISWVGPNGEAMHGFSAGASYSQLSDINQLCKNDAQTGQYVYSLMDFVLSDREKGTPPALRGLMAEEADAIIKVLQEVAVPLRPTPKQLFLTWERAYAEFERVVTEMNEASFMVEAQMIISTYFKKPSFGEMTADEVLFAADELRRMHRESPENVTLALRRCRQELTGAPAG